jgi:hypothetical protein
VVRQGLTWRGVAWAFTTTAESNYWEPLAWLSHMLDVSLFGMRPAGHHATSVVLHAVSAALLFLALRRLTGARWRSASSRAVRAPSAARRIGRLDRRAQGPSRGLFWIATLWAYAAYARRRAWRGTWASRRSSVLGLMSKPMVVTLPVVLLLLDAWPLGRVSPAAGDRGTGTCAGWGRAIVEKIPLVRSRRDARRSRSSRRRRARWSPSTHWGGDRVSANAALSAVFYLRKTVWPSGLAVFYPYGSRPRARERSRRAPSSSR